MTPAADALRIKSSYPPPYATAAALAPTSSRDTGDSKRREVDKPRLPPAIAKATLSLTGMHAFAHKLPNPLSPLLNSGGSTSSAAVDSVAKAAIGGASSPLGSTSAAAEPAGESLKALTRKHSLAGLEKDEASKRPKLEKVSKKEAADQKHDDSSTTIQTAATAAAAAAAASAASAAEATDQKANQPILTKLPGKIGAKKLYREFPQTTQGLAGLYRETVRDPNGSYKKEFVIKINYVKAAGEGLKNSKAEIQTLKSLQQLPEVVRFVEEIPINEQQIAIVTEYAGKTLAYQMLKITPLINCVKQLLAFLCKLEEAKVVHADLEVGNVCYDGGTLKVIDWGNSKAVTGFTEFFEDIRDTGRMMLELFTQQEEDMDFMNEIIAQKGFAKFSEQVADYELTEEEARGLFDLIGLMCHPKKNIPAAEALQRFTTIFPDDL